jgi:hypothetical protein
MTNKWQKYKFDITNEKYNYIWSQTWDLIEEYNALLNIFIPKKIKALILKIWDDKVEILPSDKYLHLQLRISIKGDDGVQIEKYLSYLKTIKSEYPLEELVNKLLEFWSFINRYNKWTLYISKPSYPIRC